MLRVRHLELIDAIAREGTITRAAESLTLTQPAASRTLMTIEKRLGTPLCRRTPRGMELTPAGRRLLPVARRVLGDLRRAEHELDLLRGDHSGRLRIATQGYTCYHWLPSVIRRFGRRFPLIELDLVPEATTRPFDHLRSGALDLALAHDVPADAGLHVRELFDDEHVALVAPSHPWASGRHVDVEAFASETVWFHADPEASALHREVLAPAGVSPRRAQEFRLTDAIVDAVGAGLGVTVMSRWIAAPYLARGSVVAVSVTAGGLWRRWHTVVADHRRTDRACEAFAECLAAPAARRMVAL